MIQYLFTALLFSACHFTTLDTHTHKGGGKENYTKVETKQGGYKKK